MSAALIFSVLLKMLMSAVFPEGFESINILSLALMVAGFYVLKRFKTNPLYVMLGCGCINMLVYLIKK